MPEDAKRTETPDGTPATPNVRREMDRTGRLPGHGVGDSAKPHDDRPKAKTVAVKSEDEDTGVPKNVNKEVWAQAEHAALNQGGLNGVDEQGRNKLIRSKYDQMIENDRATKKWAGENGVLGDVK
jgi:hypothetical protein